MVRALRAIVFPATLPLLLLLAGSVQATTATIDAARGVLDDFLSGLSTFSAEFTQTLVDETGFIVQETTGRLELSLPDRLRWEVDAPFRQVIVADGVELWIHDPELRQATVQKLADAQESLPLTVLTRPERIDERFALQAEETLEGYRLFLLPLDPGADFSRLTLEFSAAAELLALEFLDVFEQTTLVMLHQALRNPSVDPGRFVLDLPQGTDIFRP
jgi:outer membrane lipoprotein carrier protein